MTRMRPPPSSDCPRSPVEYRTIPIKSRITGSSRAGADSMNVALYPIFRAECRFSLGSRVPAWGARVPWCRAGRACSWCAARHGGCGIIRVDRAPRVDRVPPGGPDPPGRPFPPGYLPGPGAGGAPGPQGEQEPGGQGFRGRGRGGRFAGRAAGVAAAPPAAGGRRPRGHHGAHRGPRFQADRTYPGYLTGAPAPSTGACAPHAADGRTSRPCPRRRVTP